MANVIDANDGWPADIEINCSGTWRNASVFVAPVGPSHRGRDKLERRFQNPGSNRPMEWPDGRIALFLGLWEVDAIQPPPRPVVVSANVVERAANTTRFSVFPKVESLVGAAGDGWSDSLHDSLTHERLSYFWPEFLGVEAEVRANGLHLPVPEMVQVARAAGLGEAVNEVEAIERVRRTASNLVRDAKFAKSVTSAYHGRCAMCGLGFGLVEAAHIYPVAAAGSQDVPENGISLCRNHHRAFDRCLIYIRPSDFAVVFSPELIEKSADDYALRLFVDQTWPTVAVPETARIAGQEFLRRRHDFLEEGYSWVSSGP